MPNLFLETTVLTDLLLKLDGSQERAKQALATATSVQIPQFAWKEFKRGPLQNFVWAHNKLVETNSFAGFLSALQKLSLTPQRYKVATAIQAMHTFAATIAAMPLGDMVGVYGPGANQDSVMKDMMRLELKAQILKA